VCLPAPIRFNARTMTTGDLSQTVTIAAGDTVAEFVPAANMVCISLRVGGAELLVSPHGLEAYAQAGKTMGIPLLYPWANRLDHRGYEAAGKRVTLPDPDGRYPVDPGARRISNGTVRRCWSCSRSSTRWSSRRSSPRVRCRSRRRSWRVERSPFPSPSDFTRT
jgi:hypothetical protein